MTTLSSANRNALRITAIYVACGALWILASDLLLARLMSVDRPATLWQTTKGVAFVLISAALLYHLIHRGEVALERSRSTMANLLGNLPGMAYCCHNRERWSMKLVSDGCWALTGHSRDELAGRPGPGWASLVSPDDVEAAGAEIDAAVAEGRSYRVSYRITHRDGSERWVWEQGRCVREPNGNEQLEGFVSDVTERRRAELALRARESRFRSLIENALDVISELNVHRRFVYLSPSTERVLGWTPPQLLGCDLMDFVHQDDREQVAREFLTTQERPGTTHAVEFRFRHADGSWRVLESLSRAYQSDGGAVRVVVNSRDISMRKRVETALRLRERQQAALADLSLLALGEQELCGLADAAVEIVARVLEADRVLLLRGPAGDGSWHVAYHRGWSGPAGRGTPLKLPADSHPVRALEAGGLLAVERYGPGAPSGIEPGGEDGAPQPASGICAAIHGAPEPFGILCVQSMRPCTFGEDTEAFLKATALLLGVVVQRLETEHRLRSTEEQLRQAQRLEAVGQLAGGVAHDFNNLLTVILGFGEMLTERCSGDESSEEALRQVTGAGKRAMTLIRQLLAFSRRQTLAPRSVDLNGVIEDLSRMLRRLIGEQVKLENRLDRSVWPVWIDPGQIEQVLMNLAVNARDAMPDGGTLAIETTNMDVSRPERPGGARGRWVVLRVSDTGTGMTDDVRARVFEPFFTTKEPGRGTGLGLATVYGIVKQSGGEIRLESRLGRGTTFEICLPPSAVATRQAAGDTDRASRQQATTVGCETVLLVEDEPAVRRLVARTLTDQGYNVIEASSGNEALERCRDWPGHIDLLLSDIVLPGMKGPELYQRLTDRYPELGELYISGYSDQALGTAIAQRLLQKPFGPHELIERVRHTLDTLPARDAQG